MSKLRFAQIILHFTFIYNDCEGLQNLDIWSVPKNIIVQFKKQICSWNNLVGWLIIVNIPLENLTLMGTSSLPLMGCKI